MNQEAAPSSDGTEKDRIETVLATNPSVLPLKLQLNLIKLLK